MKGIVVECDNKAAIILTDDGLFTKVKNKNYETGQTVDIKGNRKAVSKIIAGAAGLVAAAAICTIGGFAYFTPTDYVSLDVNPSVEYSINMFDRILDVKAVNDDGKEILSSLNLKHMAIEKAVKKTLDKLMEEGYLIDDPYGGVIITTSNDELGNAEKLASELEQEIQGYLDHKEGVAARVEAKAVGMESVRKAKELGVTPGKLNLVKKLQASTSGAIDLQDWLTVPVKDINKAIYKNRESAKDKSKEQKKDSKQKDGNPKAEKLKEENSKADQLKKENPKADQLKEENPKAEKLEEENSEAEKLEEKNLKAEKMREENPEAEKMKEENQKEENQKEEKLKEEKWKAEDSPVFQTEDSADKNTWKTNPSETEKEQIKMENESEENEKDHPDKSKSSNGNRKKSDD